MVELYGDDRVIDSMPYRTPTRIGKRRKPMPDHTTETRDILLAQLKRLDKLAGSICADDDALPLGALPTITAAMCAIARELKP